jgi:hypothetical protein
VGTKLRCGLVFGDVGLHSFEVGNPQRLGGFLSKQRPYMRIYANAVGRKRTCLDWPPLSAKKAAGFRFF